MLARLSDHRALNAVGGAQRAQRIRGGGLIIAIAGGITADGEPARHPGVGPWRVMTVVGSNAAHASALPPNSRAMVCALVPELGPRSPAMSSNALNMSGCMTVRSTAQVPPIDQPTTPQLAQSGLTPKFEIIKGTTSLVR